MSNTKRERQRARRQAQLDADQKAAKSSKRSKVIFRWAAIAAAVVLVAFLWSLTGGESSDLSDVDSAEEASIGAKTLGIEGCPSATDSAAPKTQFATPPQVCIDTGQLYSAKFVTSLGDFTAVLDPTSDWRSVNNFIFLARHRAYDGTLFHRVIEDFVIQGGDVEGLNGLGGPGYKFTGAYGPEEGYSGGSLAMANQGTPNTNGSQFFVVSGPYGAALDPNYSLMGHIVEGLDVVLRIQQVETDSQDLPLEPVSISSVAVDIATSTEIDSYKDLNE